MTLPYRFSERSVMRYLPVLKLIQDTELPTRLEFDPFSVGVNAETAACRLRDAFTALSQGMLTLNTINPTLLKERFRHYVVKHDGVKVYVVPRTEKKDLTSVQPRSLVESSQPVLELAVVDAGDAIVLNAFATLLGRRLLQGQIKILGQLDQATQDALTSNNDIVIMPNDDGSHVML